MNIFTLAFFLVCVNVVKLSLSFEEELVEIPVKRLLSRHRRFIAPGTRWDWLVGWETISENFEIRFYLMTRYMMDYLFGGFSAYAAEIAGQDAAYVATKATKDAVLVASGQAGGGGGGPFKKRKGDESSLDNSQPSSSQNRVSRSVLECKDNVENVLTRTVAHDQMEIYQRIEKSLEYSGLPGRPCLLRAICELREVPINSRHIVGQMMTNFFMPKLYQHEMLEVYQVAEKVGVNHGNCDQAYPECPFSVFEVFPTFNPDKEEIEVTFEPIQSSSKSKQTFEDNIDRLFGGGKINSNFDLDN